MKTTPSKRNNIKLIRNGLEFIQSHIEIIKNAKEFLFLHTYIFEVDETTRPIINELITARKRGVKIYLIIDGVGSMNFPLETVQKLREEGIMIDFFTSFFNFARRLHQKVLLADNEVCVMGGINLARRFNNPNEDSPWLDFSLFIEGEEVFNIYLKVLKHYLKSFPEQRKELLSYKSFHHYSDQNILVKTNENDWIFRQTEITKSYYSGIRNSQTKIYILATYFLPGKKLLKELSHARKKGVEVILIFGSLSDHRLVQICEKYFFEWYLKEDFKLYLWEHSIVHGKLALADHRWSSIGSYNHNYLSKYGNSELNCEVINQEFNACLEKEFIHIIEQSKPVSIDDIELTNKFLSALTYILLNVLTLFSLVFLYRQSDESKENIAR